MKAHELKHYARQGRLRYGNTPRAVDEAMTHVMWDHLFDARTAAEHDRRVAEVRTGIARLLGVKVAP